MFLFSIKRYLKSPLLWVLVLVTSIFLGMEFEPYFDFFPIQSEQELVRMADTGGASDFVKTLDHYSEKEQVQKIKTFYQRILQTDEDLSDGERKIIEEEFLTLSNIEALYDAFNNIYFYSIDYGREDLHQAYFDKLTLTSGETYKDVNARIDQSLINNRISECFSLRFADRLMIIWVLPLFVLVSFKYYSMHYKDSKELTYCKQIRSSKFVLANIFAEMFMVSMLTFAQIMVFGIFFNMHIQDVYTSSISDFIFTYAFIVLPTLLVLIALLNVLYYIFESAIVAFPIYYVITKISSKIDPVSGYSINKTNLIIRYDTLFQSFSELEWSDLIFNRGFVTGVSILLIFITILVFNQKRIGRFEIKLLPLKES